MSMITWVLAEEPCEKVALAIGIVEERLGSDTEVQWVSPGPVVEPIPE